MTQLTEYAGNVFGPERCDGIDTAAPQKISSKHTQQHGNNCLEHVRQDHQKCELPAEDPVEIGQAGISAPVLPNVVPKDKPGYQNRTVGAAQKIGHYTQEHHTDDHQKDLHSVSPSSPFCLIISLMGVPSKPNTARSWFSRYL